MNPIFKLGIKGHIKLYRASNGKRGATVRGMPVLLLTTIGRRSGKQRTVPLVYVTDGENPVVAGSYAGSDKHPAWFLNLRESPEVTVELGAERFAATAAIAEGEQRDRLWARIIEAGPFFADEYQVKTSRVIPVIVLERARNPEPAA